jgi:hypothetical protein
MAPPALVTLDLDLPHARFDELMLKIKTTAGWEAVRVLMLTATPNSAVPQPAPPGHRLRVSHSQRALVLPAGIFRQTLFLYSKVARPGRR